MKSVLSPSSLHGRGTWGMGRVSESLRSHGDGAESQPGWPGWSPRSKPVVPKAHLWTLAVPKTLSEGQVKTTVIKTTCFCLSTVLAGGVTATEAEQLAPWHESRHPHPTVPVSHHSLHLALSLSLSHIYSYLHYDYAAWNNNMIWLNLDALPLSVFVLCDLFQGTGTHSEVVLVLVSYPNTPNWSLPLDRSGHTAPSQCPTSEKGLLRRHATHTQRQRTELTAPCHKQRRPSTWTETGTMKEQHGLEGGWYERETSC